MTTRLLLTIGLALAGGVASGQPPYRLDRVHADLLFTPGAGTPTSSGAWAAPLVRVEAPAATYLASETILTVNDTPGVTRLSRPAGSQWNFTGTAAGAPLWVLQQGNNQANQLFLGTRSEGNFTAWSPGSGLLTSAWLELTPRKISGPGEFSVWQSGSLGAIDPLVSTADASLTLFNNRMYHSAGGHAHFNYAFTAPGVYEIGFDVKANSAAGFLLSDPTMPLVFTFEVQPIPEPAGLLAAAAAAGWAIRRLRRR